MPVANAQQPVGDRHGGQARDKVLAQPEKRLVGRAQFLESIPCKIDQGLTNIWIEKCRVNLLLQQIFGQSLRVVCKFLFGLVL
jgi:hypothetical protein